MEHLCLKCGAAVEDGTPFCPQCNAPQIRVQSPATAPATPPMPPGTPDELQPPAEPLSHAAHQQPHPIEKPPAMLATPGGEGRPRRSSVRAALWAGAIAGLGSAVPFMPFILLSMVAAGGMSIAFYMRREPDRAVTAGDGLRIGALAGMFGFLINATLSTLSMLFPTIRSMARAEVMDRWREAMARTSDPQALETLRRIGDQLNTPGGLALIFTFVLVVQAVLFVVFSGLGGAIGASLFGRRHQ